MIHVTPRPLLLDQWRTTCEALSAAMLTFLSEERDRESHEIENHFLYIADLLGTLNKLNGQLYSHVRRTP